MFEISSIRKNDTSDFRICARAAACQDNCPNVESIIYNIANKLKIGIQLFDRSQGKIGFSPHAWVPVTQNLVVSVHLDAQICI